MVRELYTEDVRWQAQAERKWLAELLADESATKMLLRFFASDGNRGNGRSKEEGARMGEKERPSR